VAAAAACPDRLRIRAGTTKVALRRLAESKLPSAIVRRPKKGFGIPLAAWLKGPLADWCGALLSEDIIRSQGLVEPAVVSRLLHQHQSGQRNHAKILWNLCALSHFAAAVQR
jgi:asparagine synthase (glutamine-hydrolysing)